MAFVEGQRKFAVVPALVEFIRLLVILLKNWMKK